jgi:error-prone DNA polymerase
MLTAIRKSFDMLRDTGGLDLNLANIPQDDPAVYDMICRADTIGVFQIESRAQMSMLPRLKPRCFYDLVIEVAIVRPGPIQGQMVHPYLRRRQGLEEETYPNDAIRAVLEKTLGVPIFQEQAMRLAVVAAGFTPGEADQLRRAMAAWRRPGLIDQFKKKLLEGMQANGLSEEFAQRVYQQIRGFGEYGFPESHAASFALLVYASAWIKHHYPAVFAAAMINSQPLGFYAPAQLIRDARDHNVEVLPPDVNHSDWNCTASPLQRAEALQRAKSLQRAEALQPEGDKALQPTDSTLRLGLRLITGLRESTAETITLARRAAPFTSLADFTRRTGLRQAEIGRLADADAFRSLERTRRESLWEALAQEKTPHPQPLFHCLTIDERTPALPPMALKDEVIADYRTISLSLRAHPISFYRAELEKLCITPAKELGNKKNGAPIRVAGLVLLRQRPSTAKGITFVTLEDETGTINLVVHQHTWDKYYRVARRAQIWLAQGELQIAESVVHVVVGRLEDLAVRLQTDLAPKSRDFR